MFERFPFCQFINKDPNLMCGTLRTFRDFESICAVSLSPSARPQIVIMYSHNSWLT